jgi:hypothetical protein
VKESNVLHVFEKITLSTSFFLKRTSNKSREIWGRATGLYTKIIIESALPTIDRKEKKPRLRMGVKPIQRTSYLYLFIL